MTTQTLDAFDEQYLEMWTEPDPRLRRATVERLWADGGRLVISSLGVTIEGVEAIAAHVGQVHEQNIVGRGLRFAYDQRAEAGEALLLRWSMLVPDGGVAGRGVDVVFRDPDGRVRTVYMFMGID